MTQPPGPPPEPHDVFDAPPPRRRPKPPPLPPLPPLAYPGLPAPGDGVSYGDPVPPPYWPPAYPLGYPPPQPAPQRARWPWIVVAVAIVAASALAIGWVLTRSNHPSTHRIALPASFDGYSRLDSAAVEQQVRMMRQLAASSAGSRLLDNASIGAYSMESGDTPGLIVIALPASVSGTSTDPFASGGAALVPQIATFPSGPHGGSLRCGNMPIGTLSLGLCVWSDAKTVGMLLNVRPPLTPQATSAVANAFRDAIER